MKIHLFFFLHSYTFKHHIHQMKLMSPPPQEMTYILPHPPSVPSWGGCACDHLTCMLWNCRPHSRNFQEPPHLAIEALQWRAFPCNASLPAPGQGTCRPGGAQPGTPQCSRPGSPPELAPSPHPLSSRALSWEAWSSGKFFNSCPCQVSKQIFNIWSSSSNTAWIL